MIWLLLCLTLSAADRDELLQLRQDRRYFELRRALLQSGQSATETLFYRGVVAGRFGHEEEGIRLLQEFLSTNPGEERAREARQEISSAFVRLGRFDEALRSWPEADPLIASLRDFAPQAVEFGEARPVQATRNKLGSWDVPVQVNGVQGQWIFDTGANFSSVCESEAKRMGLKIRDSAATVSGITGDSNATRVASADVWLGSAHIRNVVFLVFADQLMYLAPLRFQMRGFLGLPAIRALKRVGISRKGVVRIGATTGATGEPNLFFDSQNPVAEFSHYERRLQLVVDTGAFASEFYPSFRSALQPAEVTKMKKVGQKVGGVGNTIIERKIDQLPELWIGVPGRRLKIRRANFTPAPEGDKRYWDGWMGIDALKGGFVFDFEAMRFMVE